MDEYPNSEEEFELMYGDELQMLNEQEEEELLDFHTAGPSSRKSLDFTTPKNKVKSQTIKKKTVEPQPCSSKQADVLENSFDRDFRKLDDSDLNPKKRNIEELFGNIDDLILEEERNNLAKKLKTDDEKKLEDYELIDRIISMRKLAVDKLNPSLSINHDKKYSSYQHIKDNVSFRLPKYPFIAATKHDGDRFYIRMHDEAYEKEDIRRIADNNSYKGLMGNQSKDLWEKANEIINKQIEEDKSEETIMALENTDNSKLWAELYKPRKYTELLSDESTNRTLLKWLKLWDKVVFHRRPRVRTKKPQYNKYPNSKYPSKFIKKELDITLDEHDRPQNKVALLCGPPGLGKTTLAHMVAKHAGYNVVEVNASDDRNVESFKTALENATQMKSVIDKDGRPNCLVFDEIDGAPSASIEFLIKFINGVAGKKRNKKQKPTVLKRPIICICNDVYVPALRPLRQIAFVLNFPPTSSARLAERLMEIARHQQIKTDLGAMLSLSEKTSNDIRSCLTVLNFFKTKNKPVTLSEIEKANIGQKDMQKGLFTVWNEIFEIKRTNANKEEIPPNERMKNILDTVITFGDYERLTQGVFENYPLVKHKGTPFQPICSAMEWFTYSDSLSKKILETQNYTLASYLPYGFVVWHFAFASYGKQKISYPSVGYEVNTKKAKQTAIITEILRGIPSYLRSYVSSDSLRLDILPMFADILVPNLRTINVSLYAPQEKVQIINVVNIMIDYNLTYVQERNAEGAYIFYIDPNIEETYTYEGLKVNRKVLSYTSRQMLAREIELEKMRRVEKSLHRTSDKIMEIDDKSKEKMVEGKKINGDNKEKGEGSKEKGNENKGKENKGEEKENEGANKPVLPNHLQRLKARSIQPKEVIVKDFFGRVITKPAKPKFGDSSEESLAGDIWFQFKEGYSNAVRRRVKMRKLFLD